MSDILTLSIASSIIYLIFRFIEMKYVNREDKPIKSLLKDGLFVFVGVYSANFIVGQMMDGEKNTEGISTGGNRKTPAFVGDPEF
jgi:hypothetical protein